jgi:transcriptional regulator with XRE-family HTH domain
MPTPPLPATRGEPENGVASPTRFHRWRLAKGWSQTQCGDLIGWGVQEINRVETGRRQLGPASKVKLAAALGARVIDLFEPRPRRPYRRRQKSRRA